MMMQLPAADYGEVIRLAPGDPRGWRNRGLIRPFKEDLAHGIADYDQAIKLDPTDAYSHNNRGQAKLRKGARDGVIAVFKKALELRPDLRQVQEIVRRLGAR